ncbi:hypothetical protein [Pontibacter sp. 172403-2]|uniref:hypothetical protein n=1 Tax=Pontibacter rufus TaxID=2791028 RepID=UPI0018AF7262|nr:hypothetical protein [Pontibacter sp. 172403-2]
MKSLKLWIILLVFFSFSTCCLGQLLELDLRDDITQPKNWIGVVIRDNTISGHAFVIFEGMTLKKDLPN